jgi:ornithine cyclodeaminase
MSVRFFGKDEVERLLPMGECIELMAEVLSDLSRGKGYQPLRGIHRPPGIEGAMALMPAAWAGSSGPVLGLKAVCIFPGNRALGEDAHQGAVVLLSGRTGKPLALLDGSAVTTIRTAAVSAVATRALARPEASVLALVGAGVQGRAHLESIAAVRRLTEVRVASLGGGTAREFAKEFSPRYPFPIRATSVEEAVRGAGIVATLTTSKEPVLDSAWLARGAHVNAVGSSVPTSRELDGKTLAGGVLFADRRESLENESGEYVQALRAGEITPGVVRAELGEVLTGARPGRTSADEVTIFKSLGLGIEDVAAASHVFRKASPKDEA